MRFYCFICLSFLLVILNSCSIQKRNYRNGYHVEWKNDVANVKDGKKNNSAEIPEQMAPATVSLLNATSPEKNITASLISKEPEPVFTGNKTFLDNCDTLVLRNGDAILAKVLEVDPREIKYKNCNNLNGPTYVIEKNKVDYVIYTNGQREDFKIEQAYIADKIGGRDDTEEYVMKMARTSMIYGIIAFPLLSTYGIGAIVFGLLAIRKSRNAMMLIGKNKIYDKKIINYAQKGTKLGTIAMILGFIVLALIVLLYMYVLHLI